MKHLDKYLNQVIHVTIDRPKGSKHPKFDFEYPINYGYMPDTISGDGKEIDAYILGVEEPLKQFTGKCIAIIERHDDDDPKLVLAPEGMMFSDEEIIKAVHFQEQWFDSYIKR